MASTRNRKLFASALAAATVVGAAAQAPAAMAADIAPHVIESVTVTNSEGKEMSQKDIDGIKKGNIDDGRLLYNVSLKFHLPNSAKKGDTYTFDWSTNYPASTEIMIKNKGESDDEASMKLTFDGKGKATLEVLKNGCGREGSFGTGIVTGKGEVVGGDVKDGDGKVVGKIFKYDEIVVPKATKLPEGKSYEDSDSCKPGEVSIDDGDGSGNGGDKGDGSDNGGDKGDGSGNGSDNGSGNGSGNGSDNGSGNGSGNGSDNGSGSGDGSGNGSGDGSGNDGGSDKGDGSGDGSSDSSGDGSDSTDDSDTTSDEDGAGAGTDFLNNPNGNQNGAGAGAGGFTDDSANKKAELTRSGGGESVSVSDDEKVGPEVNTGGTVENLSFFQKIFKMFG